MRTTNQEIQRAIAGYDKQAFQKVGFDVTDPYGLAAAVKDIYRFWGDDALRAFSAMMAANDLVFLEQHCEIKKGWPKWVHTEIEKRTLDRCPTCYVIDHPMTYKFREDGSSRLVCHIYNTHLKELHDFWDKMDFDAWVRGDSHYFPGRAFEVQLYRPKEKCRGKRDLKFFHGDKDPS